MKKGADVSAVDKSSKRPDQSRKIAFVFVGLLAGLLSLYAAVTLGELGDAGLQDATGRWVYDTVVLGAAAVVLWRAVRIEGERRAWLWLGTGMLLWALGQTYYSTILYYAEPAPFPSPADLGFLAFYPASFVALVLLLRARLRGCLSRWRWTEAPISAIAAKKRKGMAAGSYGSSRWKRTPMYPRWTNRLLDLIGGGRSFSPASACSRPCSPSTPSS